VTAYELLLRYLGPILGIFFVLLVGTTALAVVQAVRLRRLEAAYRALTAGTDGGNLEEVLQAHVREVRAAVAKTQEADALARELERACRGHLQRVGFVRFNPFREAGGDQSFALALADQNGNGVVISSLHGRDVTRVYGKPLAAWESPYLLSEEEQQAITKAKGERA